MKYLYSMLIKLFFPVFLGALTFFVLLLQLIDLFQNISHYSLQNVPIKIILQIALYYLPKTISFSLPMALLFSISFTMGNLYSNNELISIFAAGIKLIRFVFPLIFIGLLLSIGGFYFDDAVVIKTYSKKNEIQDRALSKVKSFDNQNIVLTSKERDIIYHVEHYNDQEKSLSDVIVLERDMDDKKLLQRIDSDKAYWRDGVWSFSDALVYSIDKESGLYRSVFYDNYEEIKFNMPIESFQNPIKDISEMDLESAKKWIKHLEDTGKYKRALESTMDYLERYTMTLTPLIVAFLSCALGGRFKKNVLLMSLLSSLSISVCYYVFQLITEQLSLRVSAVPPLMGAWAPFITFAFIGLVLFKNAKT